MFLLGHAHADITPEPGLTLCGFASRCDRPSEAIDDPLEVHVLVADGGDGPVLLAIFDLLALGPEITGDLHAALDVAGIDIPAERRILACTHTHSGPATVKLLACGTVEPDYLALVVRRTVEAARAAVASMRPAVMRMTSAPVTGVSYYRRSLLADGRVSMAADNEGVVQAGPTWDVMRFVRFEDAAGQPIITLLHWACHPVTRGALAVTADLAGAVRRRFAEQFGTPAVFIQGAAGDINPTVFGQSREQLHDLAGGIIAQLGDLRWSEPVSPRPCAVVTRTLQAGYEPPLSIEELTRWTDGMRVIVETGQGPADAEALLHGFFGTQPGSEFDPRHRHIAKAMGQWADITRARLLADPAPTCPVRLSVWRLGPVVWCAIPAEPFVETAIALQAAHPEWAVEVIGYAAPIIGYLPTDDAIAQGGYEAADAYRYYAHPAVFARGTEAAVRAELASMIAGLPAGV